RHRQDDGWVLEGTLRSAQHPRNAVEHARTEARRQAARLRRRRRLVLSRRCRAPARGLAEHALESVLRRRSRLPAARAALLGPARRRARSENDRAPRAHRPTRRRSAIVEVLVMGPWLMADG